MSVGENDFSKEENHARTCLNAAGGNIFKPSAAFFFRCLDPIPALQLGLTPPLFLADDQTAPT